MKKVINAGIGGRSFAMDEDAYAKLKKYLSTFEKGGKAGHQSQEVMEDLEERIAELFAEEITNYRNVVDSALVEKVIIQLGMPDGESYHETTNNPVSDILDGKRPERKFYRNPCNKSIAGVCSGIAAYFNIDILLVRILFVVALFIGTGGFWVYVILWIAAPLAETPAQKCEMYGIPATAENLIKFSSKK